MPKGYNSVTGAIVTPVINRVRSIATFTRPSDTTAYTIGDIVGPVTTPALQKLSGIGRSNGGSGRIMDVLLECNLATITLGTFRLHFFNKAHTPAADNAAFTTLNANVADYLGYCDPPILVADAAGNGQGITRLNAGIDATKGIPLQFVCASGDSALYVAIIALGAYVPSSAETWSLQVIAEQD